MKKAYAKPKVTSKKLNAKLYSRSKTPLSAVEDLLISDVYATTYTTFIPAIFSDRRLKTGIRPAANALSLLDQIKGYRYSYAWDKGRTGRMGVLAQELQKVCPELVSKIPHTPYLGVSYSGITALLLEAVKELSEENREINKKLRRLEHQNRDER